MASESTIFSKWDSGMRQANIQEEHCNGNLIGPPVDCSIKATMV